MSTRTIQTMRLFVTLMLVQALAACTAAETSSSEPPTVSSTVLATTTSSSTVPPTSSPSSTSLPTTAPTSTAVPRISRTVDLVAYRAANGLGWFSQPVEELPEATQSPEAVFEILATPMQNRREGKISPMLISSYVFLQFGEVSPQDLEDNAQTLRGLFIRSALMSFVDYAGNRVLDWDWRSSRIPMDVVGMIQKANELSIPVFLEINYSDYVPGSIGSGLDALQSADNIANTLSYLETLQAEGLRVDGVTFGDEIGDEAGFGSAKPTLGNSDLVARYVAYASAFKNRFPELKIYAFDSYIAATRGRVSDYFDLLRGIRDAELQEGIDLIDGFVFRESYVYMDENGRVLGSQSILDDVESLAGPEPVGRYDVFGNQHPRTDRGYLVTLIDETRAIFERDLDIGITEYLPAGPVQISESDTSVYEDIDFVIHYADLVGTYAEQGLDVVSTWMFANETDQAKSYVDKQGNQGLNYPVHEQLAQYFQGSILGVERPVEYESFRVKVYVAKDGDDYFILILNKDVVRERTIRLVRSGEFDLVLRLPERSYTSLLVKQDGILVTGVGPEQ
jgi:hypothetical protein